MSSKYCIGVDFGTDSVRAILVNALTGEQLASSVFYYPRWKEEKYCEPGKNQFRQHPLDYIEGLEFTIKDIVSKQPDDVINNILAIGIDTTGSTPAPVDKNGVPLAMHSEFSENPNAMFILWKDHTAIEEAEEINYHCRNWGGVDFSKYSGGIYSSEWFWSKILHVLRIDEKVRQNAYSWVEHCDWMTSLLTGNNNPTRIFRSRCAAGHKAMWHKDWNGLPSEEFLTKVDKLFSGLRDNLYTETYTSDTPAGTLSEYWAKRLGLNENVIVSVGLLDAHSGAVGGGIKPNALFKIMGTSTCDIMVCRYDELNDRIISGICGQVDGSVLPGYIGIEAGQSAFGDVYAWFKDVLSWTFNLIEGIDKEKIEAKIIDELSKEAEKIELTENSLVATDWFNGRRTPDADYKLKATISNLTLSSSAPEIFKALVEATCFGSRAIMERFMGYDLKINEIVALGGIASKSPFVMQTLANVLNVPIQVVKPGETCALGAAILASVAAGINKNVEEAQKNMCSGFDRTYVPDEQKVSIYNKLYEKYRKIGEHRV